MNEMIGEVVKQLCDSDDSLDKLILEEAISSSSSDEDEILGVAAAYSAIKKLNRHVARDIRVSFEYRRTGIIYDKDVLSKRYEVGQATAIRSVRRVCRNLCGMAPQFIQWPVGATALEVMEQFEKATGLPRVLGVIDGTNVRFTPNLRQGSTKKGNNFIHVQAVCDHNFLFTHVFTSTADLIHDSQVFDKSPLKEYVETPDIYFPDDSYLIGHETFGIHPNLMVPFADTEHLSPKQREFNSRISLARSMMDRTIAMWKGRWRSVAKRLPMVKVDKIPEYIIATCVLHNICLMQNDLIPCEVVPRHRNRGRLILKHRLEGAAKRFQIMNSLDTHED
ncbi:Putative nuclease HARBI1 [Eumeta japonica]|uniref:Nuclease HARBI1 n=1 Tax=Eumeta variegata TaxID=151549 RepID=A0A4C1ZSP6_EUMVA|nr:Putative nuclease HARBI1 [Eumeta japonica]